MLAAQGALFRDGQMRQGQSVGMAFVGLNALQFAVDKPVELGGFPRGKVQAPKVLALHADQLVDVGCTRQGVPSETELVEHTENAPRPLVKPDHNPRVLQQPTAVKTLLGAAGHRHLPLLGTDVVQADVLLGGLKWGGVDHGVRGGWPCDSPAALWTRPQTCQGRGTI